MRELSWEEHSFLADKQSLGSEAGFEILHAAAQLLGGDDAPSLPHDTRVHEQVQQVQRHARCHRRRQGRVHIWIRSYDNLAEFFESDAFLGHLMPTSTTAWY